MRACVKIIDRTEWENWLARDEDDQSNLDLVTSRVLALDLSVNHITSIAYGWLAAFPLLRELNLSFNGLTSLDGIAVAFHLRQLNVDNNLLGSYKPPVVLNRGMTRSLHAPPSGPWAQSNLEPDLFAPAA